MKENPLPLAIRSPAGRWTQLMLGLFVVGVAISLMIRSRLGLGPWDAFHVGIHNLSGISVGTASIVVGLAIIGGTWFLGVRPGAGTLTNMIMVGVFIDAILPWVTPATSWGWDLAYYGLGIALSGLGTGMYIGAGLGKGPRDGMMLALSERTGWPVRRMRTLIEMVVLALGWGMGGTIGVGTVLFTLLIGPATQWGLQCFGVVPPSPIRTPGAAGSRVAQRAA